MIGIGVTTFNRNRQLKKTISNINKYTEVPFKLVIVDDGSEYPVKEADFRFKENKGAPFAKNKCLELLDDCEHIFLFDDDTYPIKKGWHNLYINSGVKHLNYTFKYEYEIIDGVRHLKNPNGCMMYIHKDVLSIVGGFDIGFKKYGYWHGAFSNRVYNCDFIDHPFIDVIGSSEYIYCLDQEGINHKTATINRSSFLKDNKKRYFETLNSNEYHEYKTKQNPSIHYSNPFSVEKNIGKSLNEFCEMVPDGDWVCLQDGDMAYQTPDWGKQIKHVVDNISDEYGLIGCMTNRLARPIQTVPDMFDEHDMRKHYAKAIELSKNNWGVVEDITEKKYIAGLFMLFPKRIWNLCKFPENNIAFDDVFSKLVTGHGYKLGLMKGLYVYHQYRIWSDTPTKERKHLKK